MEFYQMFHCNSYNVPWEGTLGFKGLMNIDGIKNLLNMSESLDQITDKHRYCQNIDETA